MFIRSPKLDGLWIGGLPSQSRITKANTYATAYPFNSCGANGVAYPVAYISLHGYNAAVTTLTDLWPQGTVRTLPTAGFTIGVSSSSASDTNSAGTGARIVQVDFLDTSYIPHTINVVLNGQTMVSDTTQVATAFRINDIRCVSVGSGTTNAGDIYVYDNTDTVTAGVPQTATKIFHKVVAGDSIGRGGFYTVPAGCALQVNQIRAGIDDTTTTARAVQINAKVTIYNGGQNIPVLFPIGSQLVGGELIEDLAFPTIIDEKSDIAFKVTSSAAAAVSGFVDSVLYYK